MATPGGALGSPARRRLPLLLVLAGAVALIVALALTRSGSRDQPSSPASEAVVGSWKDTAPLSSIRGTTEAVLLTDGRVLAAGGGVGAIPLAAAELFDPKSGVWQPATPMSTARRGHRAVALTDGTVLVAGGIAGGELLASVERYDPKRDAWSAVAPMSKARLGHTLTVLPDGRVLAVGGTGSGGGAAAGGQTINPDASAELFDPASGRWMAAGAMGVARFEHTATAMPDGRVLVVGGLGPSPTGIVPLASAEVYDPAAGAFVRSTDLRDARTNHVASLLPDGSVLVAGGAGGPSGEVALASAERFDPKRAAWTATGALAEARRGAAVAALADGRVLVIGGEATSGSSRRSLGTAELFDPHAGRWRPAGRGLCPRSEHSAVRTGDASVLSVAGDAAFPGQAPAAQSCSERFTP